MPYLTVAQVRALPNLDDVTKFPDAALTAAVEWFETVFEDYTAVAWIPRTVTDERHRVTGATTILLEHLYPRAVSAVRSYSAAATSTPYTVGELAEISVDQSGAMYRGLTEFTSTYGVIAVDYTHGFTTPPADVLEAAKTAVRAHLIDNYQANRQYAVATEAGIIRNSQPGDDRPFGIPEVDAVANRRRHRTPVIA